MFYFIIKLLKVKFKNKSSIKIELTWFFLHDWVKVIFLLDYKTVFTYYNSPSTFKIIILMVIIHFASLKKTCCIIVISHYLSILTNGCKFQFISH
jgi:hypothetical protein